MTSSTTIRIPTASAIARRTHRVCGSTQAPLPGAAPWQAITPAREQYDPRSGGRERFGWVEREVVLERPTARTETLRTESPQFPVPSSQSVDGRYVLGRYLL